MPFGFQNAEADCREPIEAPKKFAELEQLERECARREGYPQPGDILCFGNHDWTHNGKPPMSCVTEIGTFLGENRVVLPAMGIGAQVRVQKLCGAPSRWAERLVAVFVPSEAA